MDYLGNQRELQKALDLLEQGDYKEAFLNLIELYNQDSDKETILGILTEVFYQPNENELRKNYEQNIRLLQAYPFFRGMDSTSFEDLDTLIFPIDETNFYLFCKKTKTFMCLYTTETKDSFPYFFSDLEKPLMVEDEISYGNLVYLWDNVRKSEDFGGDNHIYLYYKTWNHFSVLLLTEDFSPILSDEKFVFLIGEVNKVSYPIDFKREYGINYSLLKPQPLRIEEMNRFCFWYKHAHSGTVFSLGVLGSNDYVAEYCGFDFHAYSTFHGKLLLFDSIFHQLLEEKNKKYTLTDIFNLVTSPDNDIHISDIAGDLALAEKLFDRKKKYTVFELFRVFFIVQYTKKRVNPRVVPVILYDPHIWQMNIYTEMMRSFSYLTVLTCMREPIMCFARCFQKGMIAANEFQTKYLLASDYTHWQFLDPEFRGLYYGFKFEDLKLKPEQTIQSICQLLNIPYSENMLEAEAPMPDERGEIVKGWEKTALTRNIKSVLSEFDILRLKIFYEPILKYYGYPTFDSEEYDLSREDVFRLFSYPLRFERYYKKAFKLIDTDEATLRSWIYETLTSFYQEGKRGGIVFPRLLETEGEEQ